MLLLVIKFDDVTIHFFFVILRHDWPTHTEHDLNWTVKNTYHAGVPLDLIINCQIKHKKKEKNNKTLPQFVIRHNLR